MESVWPFINSHMYVLVSIWLKLSTVSFLELFQEEPILEKGKIKTSDENSEKNVLLLTISITLSCPYEKTMALGGVATGSMNANDAESVQGSMT